MTSPPSASIFSSCRLASQTVSHLLTQLKPGISEKDLAKTARRFMLKNGAQGVAFRPIIAFGNHTAHIHHRPTDRKLKPPNIVMIDLGCRVNGYCSDITRTVFVGPPTSEQKKIYQLVKRAYQAALKALTQTHPTNHSVDTAARNIINQAGYAKYFPHGTGHGLGRRIHQAPKISPRATSHMLQAGMIITIEPAIYLPRRFGIRLENTILLTSKGSRTLTTSSSITEPMLS